MEALLQEMMRVAQQAGAKIKKLRDDNLLTEDLKYGVELVTNADLIANTIIKTELLKLYPGSEYFSEEEPDRCFSLEKPTFIVDPIDGTVNYAAGHFMSGISIAYAEGRKVIAGVVYNPFLDEMFYAADKAGAFRNGRPIRVKETCELRRSLIATGFPYVKNADNIREILARMERLFPNIGDIRRLGSAALDLCWVACGRLEGYYESSLNAWDVAAGKLIAREAGASVGYFKKPPVEDTLPESVWSHNLVVSSPGIFEEFSKLLACD